jgi:hypothetical protein
MTDENPSLTIKIEYKDSISLSEFKDFLEGWNNQYIRCISLKGKEADNDVLLIKEIRQGSIIIELISSLIPLISDYNTISSFFVSLKSLFGWLISKTGNKPDMEICDLENTKKIIAPVNNHAGRQINISIEGDNNAPIIIDSVIAKTIAHNADEELEKLIEHTEIIENDENKENVILKFKQIKDDENNNKNTKGIIQEINNKEYPVLFSEGIKNRILHGSDNPFLQNYLVNVKVNKNNETIKSYTILALNDSYMDEDERYEENLFS